MLPGTSVQEDDVGILCYHFFEVGVGVASDYGDRAVVLPGDQSVGVVAVPVGTHDVIQSSDGADGLGYGRGKGHNLEILAHGILAELGVAVVGESRLVDGGHHSAADASACPGDDLLLRYVVSGRIGDRGPVPGVVEDVHPPFHLLQFGLAVHRIYGTVGILHDGVGSLGTGRVEGLVAGHPLRELHLNPIDFVVTEVDHDTLTGIDGVGGETYDGDARDREECDYPRGHEFYC